MSARRTKCARCHDAPPKRGDVLCGICQIVTSRTMLTDRPAAVPAHFNYGLGEFIEDRSHLNRRRKELKKAGVISGWE